MRREGGLRTNRKRLELLTQGSMGASWFCNDTFGNPTWHKRLVAMESGVMEKWLSDGVRFDHSVWSRG